ncbi:MAG: 4-hydroxybenzoate polyprenyltransferase [Gammaproteobacteria bacterium RIFCSPHIGHO2_02_FULL_39_13]|nr:MAG: 4-hydroxybenzoate polyprenyltransferase [Gammaproteobacteria bacterium RIFCSPHIGHO2_02_FULL_39_13]OGT49949.1 MAG: 4-hydroxybenzoate polyprenyltransferase [Gammaproteobacteria bacterium RIFCSPHIGHO2_12_FULL_39_24]
MILSYLRLMRFHKPVGILLLLWPTMWALWIASNGAPHINNIFIFVAGVILMRAAGCVINDIVDRKLDLHVSRTRTRPIATGEIATRSALILFLILCMTAFILVLFTNALTILLAFFAVMVAIIYPFMKRYTHFPQVILGIAFSFSVPMAFAAETSRVSFIAGLIMLITMLWTIMYDTEYAMADREDDLKIGIKSTAIFFEKYDRAMIGLLQSVVILLLYFLGDVKHFSVIYFSAIFICLLLFIYQQMLISKRESQNCLRAFLNNQWVGLIIFVGIFLK